MIPSEVVAGRGQAFQPGFGAVCWCLRHGYVRNPSTNCCAPRPYILQTLRRAMAIAPGRLQRRQRFGGLAVSASNLRPRYAYCFSPLLTPVVERRVPAGLAARASCRVSCVSINVGRRAYLQLQLPALLWRRFLGVGHKYERSRFLRLEKPANRLRFNVGVALASFGLTIRGL